MRILLDTHAVIWYVTENRQLPQSSYSIIEDSGNKCFVSIASFWEMGIKFSIGKLELQNDLKRIFEIIDRTGFELLPVSVEHILINSRLPFHHRDPFDRILVAQAIAEDLVIMTKDESFSKYEVKMIWK